MRSAKDIIPNGQPCPNTRIYLLDTDLTVVGPEATGEIYVSAPHLSPGYLHEPRKTADRFLSNSFEDGLSARLYRTGDLARFSANGQIELLGRVDDVVKIRGFRVELGEIESVLLSNHEVIEAAVKAWRSSGDTRLVAYIVTKNEFISTERNLRSELTRRLPEYMLPCGYMFLRSLPKTVTGKTDRSALPPLDIVRPSISTEYAAPRTKWEASIAVIWAEVLGIDCVGIYDNFFELGGHSLLAVQVAMRIEQSFSLELPAEWFFLHPTVADLSEAVIEHDNGEG
jgi:acyl carrier protein